MALFRVVDDEGQERSKSLKTKVAEVHGNRTHRAHLPVNPTGFEDRFQQMTAVEATGGK